MKNKLIIFFLTAICIIGAVIIVILYNYNSEIEEQINNKNKLIEQSAKSDSLLIEKTKEYSEKIEKYINEGGFYINNKKTSPQDIIKLLNKYVKENNELIDSLNYYKALSMTQPKTYNKYYTDEYNKIISKYKDSLEIYKWQVELVKKKYGIYYNVKRVGNQLNSTKNRRTMVDSAIVLFPYYKHKLSINKDGYFEIETDKEYRRNKKRKENGN